MLIIPAANDEMNWDMCPFQTYEIDLYCLNGTEDSLKGPDFQADDGTHRTMDLELVKGKNQNFPLFRLKFKTLRFILATLKLRTPPFRF